MCLNRAQVRAMFPGASPGLIAEHPESAFLHADVDGVFYYIWYDEESGMFHEEVKEY